VRASDSGAERGRCLHTGVFGPGSGYELCQSESDPRTGCDRGRTRSAAGDSLRQRTGVDEPTFFGLVRGAADRVSAHSTRKADAERACGELSRTVARRVSEPELVLELVRRTAEDRSVAKGVQGRTTA